MADTILGSVRQMLTLNELCKCTVMTLFQLWIQAVGLLSASILLSIKLSWGHMFSFWIVFAPLFLASILDAYFLFIVGIRCSIEKDRARRPPGLFLSVGVCRLLFTLAFEVMLCHKIDGDFEHASYVVRSSYNVVFLPMWIIVALLGLQACRVL